VLEKDIETYKQIVNRFDEIITHKASKISQEKLIHELRGYVHQDFYLKEKNNNDELFTENKHSIDKWYEMLEKIHEKMNSEITLSLKRGLTQLRNEFILHNKPENSVDFQTFNNSMKHKIEKSEVLSLLENKSNTQDTETNMKATDILHKQIKHIVVILIEVLRKDLLKLHHNGKTKNTNK